VDPAAIKNGLAQNIISGFATDVYENEKKIIAAIKEKNFNEPALVPYADLAKTFGSRIIMTPHIGASTPEAQILVAKHSARAIIDFYNGMFPVENAPYLLVNPKK
jgi:lactate dehydrogenase-like 2-hydroxyacid dehydrogenase